MSKVPESSVPGGLPDTPVVRAALDAAGGAPEAIAILRRAVAEECAGLAGGGGDDYD